MFAFIAASIITAGLGTYASVVIGRVGQLVAVTYDHSLMSINYARASAADFASMQVLSARRWTTSNHGKQLEIETTIAGLEEALHTDLRIAAERSQSSQAKLAARNVEVAAAAWSRASHELPADVSSDDAWRQLEPFAATVTQQIDLLVNYTAGNGFTYRQTAAAAVKLNRLLSLFCTALALVLLGVVAWFLTRRITGPVAAASAVAGSIAQGDLDCTIPSGARDELGALLSAMAVMRDNIKDAIAREVTLRRSAQMRLAEALESSPEGIVVLDPEGRVVLANSQAENFFGKLLVKEAAPASAGMSTSCDEDIGSVAEFSVTDADELILADGRCLRIARSRTQDGGLIAIFSDISVLKSKKEELRSANLVLDAALSNMSQGLCMFDGERKLKVVNRRFCELFRLAQNAPQLGTEHSRILALSLEAGNHPGKKLADLLAEEQRHETSADETWLQELSDDRVISVTRQKLDDGGWVATFEDVSERRRTEAKIAYMARHDAVTGLWNRLVFAEHVDVATANLGRSGEGFAVLCLDLDHFKEVNDRWGHPGGDRLLRLVADRLRACCREMDAAGRLGGDEFAILLTKLHNPDDAEAVARRVVALIGEPFDIDGQSVTIGVSIGISVAPTDGTSCEKLLKNADMALYLAKEEGRGTWRFYEPAMDIRMQARKALELDLRNAIAEEQFEIHYQPLIDLSQNRIAAFEALVRWNHPVRGLVSPVEFIPLAEETGLIVALGDWVLRRACLEATNWPPHIKVAVNVSAVQFGGDRLGSIVTDTLRETHLPADRLELEITESVLLAENSGALSTLHDLRDLGVSISMDDFGTGYSSLSYLRSFPFDKIKIDQSFVRTITTKDGSRTIVGAVVALATSLGIKSIAEGVETEQQLSWLTSIGCDELQGYYFSRPIPARDVALFIESWKPMERGREQICSLAS